MRIRRSNQRSPYHVLSGFNRVRMMLEVDPNRIKTHQTCHLEHDRISEVQRHKRQGSFLDNLLRTTLRRIKNPSFYDFVSANSHYSGSRLLATMGDF